MRHFCSFKRVFSALLALAAVFSIIQIFTYASFAAPALPAVNDQTPGTVCKTLSDDAKAYYTGTNTYENLMSLSGASNVTTSKNAAENNKLYDALKALMTSTHKYQTTYSGTGSGSLAYYWQRTDAVAGRAGSFMLIYMGKEVSINSTSSFNREHVWPKSNASFNQSGGGADLHHLRPADPKVNSTRGNLPFGNVKGVYSNATQGSCYWKTSSLFEPRDAVKGDIARILLYVYVRWGENNIYSDTGNGEKIIESLDTLLQWIALDPVDTWEMKRNDLTEDVQGNRNVFIDYPELAFRMFGRQVPAGLTTPSSDSSCTHSFKLISSTPATCTEAGQSLYQCTKCGREKTVVTEAFGHADEDNDGYCDRCDEYIGVTVTLTASQSITDGTHVAFYLPAQKLMLSKTVNNDKVATVATQPSSSKIELPDGAQIFTARAVSGGYRFVTPEGKYLTTKESGSALFYSDTATAYSLWKTVSVGGGLFQIVSVNAKYNGSEQALEYYNGAFTVYGVKDTDPYKYGIYTVGHMFDRGVTVDRGNGVQVLTQTCHICGEKKETVFGRVEGDYSKDGLVTVLDLNILINMLANDAEWTQEDDLNNDGTLSILDVSHLLDLLAGK